MKSWALSRRFTFILLPVFIILSLVMTPQAYGVVEELAIQSDTSTSNVIPQNISFSGAAAYSVPIVIPPGRAGLAPKLVLSYNSYQKNGWLGVGWSLDMGAIQRSTKYGVDYNSDDFVAMVNGSSSELVDRSNDWGQNYYGAKQEGAFSKFYKDPASGGFVQLAKDGKIYFFGTTAASRQDDPNDSSRVFKWCLDKVEDTNGNYMTITYEKDQGQIYLKQIDYTGNNAGLPTTNYVKFYLDEGQNDTPAMFTTNFSVVTAKRLKTIEVRSPTGLSRAYDFEYETYGSTSTWRTLLNYVRVYGNDASVNAITGQITGNIALSVTNFDYQASNNTFTIPDYNDPALPAHISGYNTHHNGQHSTLR